EAQVELLNDALGSGDAGYIANALGVVARARGMAKVARGAGVIREALYKTLSPSGDPQADDLARRHPVARLFPCDSADRQAAGEGRGAQAEGSLGWRSLPGGGVACRSSRWDGRCPTQLRLPAQPLGPLVDDLQGRKKHDARSPLRLITGAFRSTF